ncbi:unnamed protein product [Candidula unifasciata]|uniref:Uncharacterized protein n=1 Tax=Candidula unifasciata TaxID=100452 RepID=A0A8S3YIP6_9EUPU|nr:unnamed protein product [Candidula unifasciata]
MLALCRRRPARPVTRLSKRRLMHSTGHNIVTVGIEDKFWKYLSDLYTTLIDIKWRWNILIFVSGFVVTWLLFACMYYALSYLHGDFDEQSADFVPCILNVKTFTAAYLFSIETMMTIGYGIRVQTESCPGLYLTVMLQSIVGAGLQFMLASIVVSKTRRAKRRSETILFSNQVCIYEQDCKLHLAVRVGDMRKADIAGAHAQGYLVKKYRSQDASFLFVPILVNFKGESGRDLIFFPWPTQILHLVDEDSPLWSLSRDELLKGRFELIVVIDGVSGATSRPFQARKSYHTCEMKWGHRFDNLNLSYGWGGSYLMDLSTFDNTVPTSAPLCSARDITHLREMYKATHPEPSLPTQHNSTTSHSSQLQSTSTASDIQVFSEADSISVEPGNHLNTPVTVPRSQRSKSVEERIPPPPNIERQRRCSLGDMIRASQGDKGVKQSQYVDALNIYRHRRSVTDTYLGEEITEEGDEVYDSNQAILSVVSRRSAEKRIDSRDPSSDVEAQFNCSSVERQKIEQKRNQNMTPFRQF